MKHASMCIGLVALMVGTSMAADVGYWRLDNDPGAADGVAATTVKDECFGNDGTAFGSPLYTAGIAPTNVARMTTPPGPFYYIHHGRNGAATLNGLALGLVAANSQYVSVPHAANLEFAGKPFVIEAYVKVNAPSGSVPQWIVQKKNGADDTTDYALLANVGPTLPGAATVAYGKAGPWTGLELGLLFGNGSGAGFTMVISNIEIADPNWYFVQVSVNPAKGEVIFIKTRWWPSVVDGSYLAGKVPYGEIVTGVNGIAGQPSGGALFIGAHRSAAGVANQFFNGALDEVRICDRPFDGKPSAPWYWQMEGGGDVHGVFNEFNEQVFCLRQRESNRSQLWGVYDWNPIPGEADNYAQQCNNFGPTYQSYFFWEPASGDEQVMAENFVSDGATLSMRVKVPAYNTSAGGTRTQKFIRISQGLSGGGVAGSKLHFEVGFQGLTVGNPPVLCEGDNLATMQTPPLNDRFHRIWAVSKVIGSGQVAIKAWCDGAKFVDYVKTNSSTVSYYGPNNNSVNSSADTLLDYMRFAEAAYSFADLDFDGDVDGGDYGVFAGCYNGTDNPIGAGCDASDMDGDGDVDGVDFGIFGACFNGAGNPTPCF